MSETIKEYSNGEITVIWKPAKCIHSGICVQKLPRVYDPKAKPWIRIENATTAELRDQVSACPSGALTYRMEGSDEAADSSNDAASTGSMVTVFADGPLQVDPPVDVKQADGTVKRHERAAFLCRCGASSNKPYCDGSHKGAGFSG